MVLVWQGMSRPTWPCSSFRWCSSWLRRDLSLSSQPPHTHQAAQSVSQACFWHLGGKHRQTRSLVRAELMQIQSVPTDPSGPFRSPPTLLMCGHRPLTCRAPPRPPPSPSGATRTAPSPAPETTPATAPHASMTEPPEVTTTSTTTNTSSSTMTQVFSSPPLKSSATRRVRRPL